MYQKLSFQHVIIKILRYLSFLHTKSLKSGVHFTMQSSHMACAQWLATRPVAATLDGAALGSEKIFERLWDQVRRVED